MLFLESEDPKPILRSISSPLVVKSSQVLAIIDTMHHIKPDVLRYTAWHSMALDDSPQGAKGKRSVLPNGEVMIHQPLSGALVASDIEKNTSLKLTENNVQCLRMQIW